MATLRVVCNVPDATLWMDDQLLGRAAEWGQGRAVSAGFHRIELRHPGHYTFFAEMTLQKSEAGTVKAELRPVLD